MKIYLLTTVLSAAATCAISQPVLETNSFYQPGETVVAYDVEASEMLDGADGADKVWDFSQLTPVQQSQSWSGNVLEPSELNDFDFFADANVALQLNDGTVRYWKNDASGLVAMGQGGDQELLEMADPNRWLEYPFTFGSSFSDNASGTIYSACRNYQWSSNSETEGVGYGTLILPSGTYENVLKVRRISFTVKVNEEIGLERENNIVEHYWFQPGNHGPLLYMRTWNNNGCPGSNSGSEMVYTVPNAVTTNVETQTNADFSIDLFPNPASDITHLGIRALTSEDVAVWLTDLLGQTVLRLENQDGVKDSEVFNIDLKALSPGIYMVNVKTGEAHRSQRLVIQ